MEWSKLKAIEKARVIKLALDNGVSDINTIRDTYNIYSKGGSIHIDPSKKGTFTAAAKKHGMGVQEFASRVLANKENYSPAMVKKANFARNASHWHETGGPLYPFSFGQIPAVRYEDGGSTKKTDGYVNPYDIASRQAYAESSLNPEAKNKNGATGLFQIMPIALKDYNRVTGDSLTMSNVQNADTNIMVRNQQMESLLTAPFIDKEQSTDSIKYGKALGAFNWGRNNLLNYLNEQKAKGVDIYDSWDWLAGLPEETRDYINFILRGIDVNTQQKNEQMYREALMNNIDLDLKIRKSLLDW